MKDLKTALFAGGCFWCVESSFDKLPKVRDVESGYTEDGREAVKITYNPKETSYEELVRRFFKSIDPLDEGGQFYDRGHSYTTAIYYTDDDERMIAEKIKKEVEEKKGAEVATDIVPMNEFKKAPEHHQEYAKKNPKRYEQYYKGSGRQKYFKKRGEDNI